MTRNDLNLLDLKHESRKFNPTSNIDIISIVIAFVVAIKTFLDVEILIAFVLRPQSS